MRFPYDPKEPQSYCRSCDAPIVWIRTKRGKSMPLDLGTAKEGADGAWTAESHHAHCPDAEKWRRE